MARCPTTAAAAATGPRKLQNPAGRLTCSLHHTSIFYSSPLSATLAVTLVLYGPLTPSSISTFLANQLQLQLDSFYLSSGIFRPDISKICHSKGLTPVRASEGSSMNGKQENNPFVGPSFHASSKDPAFESIARADNNMQGCYPSVTASDPQDAFAWAASFSINTEQPQSISNVNPSHIEPGIPFDVEQDAPYDPEDFDDPGFNQPAIPTGNNPGYVLAIDPMLSGNADNGSLDWLDDGDTQEFIREFNPEVHSEQGPDGENREQITPIQQFISPSLLDNSAPFVQTEYSGFVYAQEPNSVSVASQPYPSGIQAAPGFYTQTFQGPNFSPESNQYPSDYGTPNPQMVYGIDSPVDDAATILEAIDTEEDDDATIDEEDYRTAFHSSSSSSGIANIRDYLTKRELTATEKKFGKDSTPKDKYPEPLGVVDSNVTAAPKEKRGRGRPIVPGSKRQRRLHAIAQPGYVPPKRGRPRTSDRHLRKRSHRDRVRASKKLAAMGSENQSALPPVEEYLESPEESYIVDFDQSPSYKPVYFILSELQVRKVAQMFNIPAPEIGWACQDIRWQVTCNLRKVIPTSESLIRMVSDLLERQAAEIDKENTNPSYPDGPSDGRTAANSPTPPTECPHSGLSPEILAQIPYIPVPEPGIGETFPDSRIKIVTGQSGDDVVLRMAAPEEILHKLKDDKDVYFRAFIWEILKGSMEVDDMEFIGTFNTSWGHLEFV